MQPISIQNVSLYFSLTKIALTYQILILSPNPLSLFFNSRYENRFPKNYQIIITDDHHFALYKTFSTNNNYLPCGDHAGSS